MNNFLTDQDRKFLKALHSQEKNRRHADRIKTVLLADAGWTYRSIAEALLLDEQTISRHISEFQEEKKLKNWSGGSFEKMSALQNNELELHLEKNIYVKTIDICRYVKEKFNVIYSISGMRSWLNKRKFTFKKPKEIPSKADPAKQEDFIEDYEFLIRTTPANEPILFLDATHPTMATKVSHGWIKKGKEKNIPTTASRTRINILGAINLKSMDLFSQNHKTIDSDSMELFFDHLKEMNPSAQKIHIILDNGPYNTSNQTKVAAEKRGIVLHYLPTYSPNLNPIERVWKVMNEFVRNNQFFKSAKDFRQEIMNFFETTWKSIQESMRSRVNDNFQKFNSTL